MLTDNIDNTNKDNSEKQLHTEGPLDERDNVKKAEERTRELQKKAEDPSQSTKDADK
jgi:hypothetical protein